MLSIRYIAASCDESLWFFMIFWDVFFRKTQVFISKKCNKLPRKLSHLVIVSKKSQSVTPHLVRQVQGELSPNLFIQSQAKSKIWNEFMKGRKQKSPESRPFKKTCVGNYPGNKDNHIIWWKRCSQNAFRKMKCDQYLTFLRVSVRDPVYQRTACLSVPVWLSLWAMWWRYHQASMLLHCLDWSLPPAEFELRGHLLSEHWGHSCPLAMALLAAAVALHAAPSHITATSQRALSLKSVCQAAHGVISTMLQYVWAGWAKISCSRCLWYLPQWPNRVRVCTWATLQADLGR